MPSPLGDSEPVQGVQQMDEIEKAKKVVEDDQMKDDDEIEKVYKDDEKQDNNDNEMEDVDEIEKVYEDGDNDEKKNEKKNENEENEKDEKDKEEEEEPKRSWQLHNVVRKSRIVQRVLKDLISYEHELLVDKDRVEKIKESDDHSKLKQMENVVNETEGMIPEVASILEAAINDLEEGFLVYYEKEVSTASREADDLELCKTLMAEAKKKLENTKET